MLDEDFEVLRVGDEGEFDKDGGHSGFTQDGEVRAFFDASVGGVQGACELVLDAAGERFAIGAFGVNECFGAARVFIGEGVAVDGDEYIRAA